MGGVFGVGLVLNIGVVVVFCGERGMRLYVEVFVEYIFPVPCLSSYTWPGLQCGWACRLLLSVGVK